LFVAFEIGPIVPATVDLYGPSGALFTIAVGVSSEDVSSAYTQHL
jgi:hypothetical protein